MNGSVNVINELRKDISAIDFLFEKTFFGFLSDLVDKNDVRQVQRLPPHPPQFVGEMLLQTKIWEFYILFVGGLLTSGKCYEGKQIETMHGKEQMEPDQCRLLAFISLNKSASVANTSRGIRLVQVELQVLCCCLLCCTKWL